MNRTAIFLGLCILFTGFVSLNSLAQEPPQNFLVVEEFVSPADMPAFKQAQNKTFELLDSNDVNLSFWTYRTDESSFYWVMPFEKFASLDGMFEEMNHLQKKMLEAGFNADK